MPDAVRFQHAGKSKVPGSLDQGAGVYPADVSEEDRRRPQRERGLLLNQVSEEGPRY